VIVVVIVVVSMERRLKEGSLEKWLKEINVELDEEGVISLYHTK